MSALQQAFVLMLLTYVCHGAFLRDGGRNDGEPDYNPGFMDVRDDGQNDGEPDYNPTYLEFRSEDDNDEVQVPDSVWQNEANHARSRLYVILNPDDVKGN